jgi:hypothetical protein
MTHEQRKKYEDLLGMDIYSPAIEAIDNSRLSDFINVLNTAEDNIKEDLDNARTAIIIEYSIINDLRNMMKDLIKLSDNARKEGNTDEAGKYEESCEQFYNGIYSCLENIEDKSEHLSVLESSLEFIKDLRSYYIENKKKG